MCAHESLHSKVAHLRITRQFEKSCGRLCPIAKRSVHMCVMKHRDFVGPFAGIMYRLHTYGVILHVDNACETEARLCSFGFILSFLFLSDVLIHIHIGDRCHVGLRVRYGEEEPTNDVVTRRLLQYFWQIAMTWEDFSNDATVSSQTP